MWKRACARIPITYSPVENGWLLTASGKYKLNWFEGDKVPHALSEVLDDDALEDEEEEDDNLYACNQTVNMILMIICLTKTFITKA